MQMSDLTVLYGTMLYFSCGWCGKEQQDRLSDGTMIHRIYFNWLIHYSVDGSPLISVVDTQKCAETFSFVSAEMNVCRLVMNQYVRRHSRRSVKCLTQQNSVPRAQSFWQSRNVANLASKTGSVFMSCSTF